MTNQLLLIEPRPTWRLDRATRAQGLQGVAKARAVLRTVNSKRTNDECVETPQAEVAEHQSALSFSEAA